MNKELNNSDKIESLILIRSKMQAEFNGGGVRPKDVTNAEETKMFWSKIWSVVEEHNQAAERLKTFTNELENDKHLQERVVRSAEKVTKQCRNLPNWKVPGKVGT